LTYVCKIVALAELYGDTKNDSYHTELHNVVHGLTQIVDAVSSYELRPTIAANATAVAMVMDDARTVACTFIKELAKDVTLTPLLAYLTIRSLSKLMQQFCSNNSSNDTISDSSHATHDIKESKLAEMLPSIHSNDRWSGGVTAMNTTTDDDHSTAATAATAVTAVMNNSINERSSSYYDAIDNSYALCETMEGILIEIHNRLQCGDYHRTNYNNRTIIQSICSVAMIDIQSWRLVWQRVYDMATCSGSIGNDAPLIAHYIRRIATLQSPLISSISDITSPCASNAAASASSSLLMGHIIATAATGMPSSLSPSLY
jgi:hypothetical protein